MKSYSEHHKTLHYVFVDQFIYAQLTPRNVLYIWRSPYRH